MASRLFCWLLLGAKNNIKPLLLRIGENVGR